MFLGVSPDLGAPVVVRVLVAENTGALVVRDRVLRQASIAQGFKHRALVPVGEVIREGREVHVVREFVDGLDLDRVAEDYRRRGEAFPLSAVLVILYECLSALSYLHSNIAQSGANESDWVHGAITVHNVLINRKGAVQMTGFGFGDLGTREKSIDLWKARRMNYMSPRYICAGHLGVEEDLFALGALAYHLIAGEPLYSPIRETNAEALRTAISEWGGLEVEGLVKSSGSKTLSAVIKRLATPRPGSAFLSAQEARDALGSVVSPPLESERKRILMGVLDGSERHVNDWQRVWKEETTASHPVGEGGATRTILDSVVRGVKDGVAGASLTLRGASTEELGKEFESAKMSFGEIRSKEKDSTVADQDEASKSHSGGVIRRAEVRVKPQLRDSSDANFKRMLENESTLDMGENAFREAKERHKVLSDPTLDVDRAEIFPQGLSGVSPTINIPFPLSIAGDNPSAGQDDKTLDVDSQRVFPSKSNATVVRMKTPLPLSVGTHKKKVTVRVASPEKKRSWEKAVLSDALPPISNSNTFRSLAFLLGVLFVLIGVLVFLLLRRDDFRKVANTHATVVMEAPLEYRHGAGDGEDEGNPGFFDVRHSHS